MNPLNRRQFLITAAAVLAGAAGCRLRPAAPKPGAEVPPPPAAPAEPQPVRIALLSDPHTQEAGAAAAGAINGKLADAVADYLPLRPNYWLVCGDVADHGYPGEFQAFRKVMAAAARPEQLLVTTGNHEFYDQSASDEEAVGRFTAAFGLAQPYSNRVIEGIHFIMLADEQWKTAPYNPDWAWLSHQQLSWFEAVLAEHREKFTVVSLHQPLQETVLWSHGGNGFAGVGQSERIREILSANPQIRLWLSGHTHQLMEAPGQVAREGAVTFVALPSTYYQFVPSQAEEDQGGWPSSGGFTKDAGSNQSRLLEIWPDQLVLKARDHQRKVWLQEHEIVLGRA